MSIRDCRHWILRRLDFLPDSWVVWIQYLIKTRHVLHLKNPKRFSEKLQHLKVYYRDPLMSRCADKYEVRKYISSLGLDSILNECYGVYDRVESIDWDSLPNRYVLKDTLGGAGLSVILIQDNRSADKEELRKTLYRWLKEPYDKKHTGREWVYDGHPHRIIIEKYLESDANVGGLLDYKFFCNYGECKLVYVIADRSLGKGGSLGIFTPDFKRVKAERKDERPLVREIEKPVSYNEMRAIAERIARPFPEARVDLYNIEGRIIFGEITFFDGSGYMRFNPDDFDKEFGDMFQFFYDEKWSLRPRDSK